MATDIGEKTFFLNCTCSEVGHGIRFQYFSPRLAYIDSKDEGPELYISAQLDTHMSFWERVKAAVKYVFGKPCKYHQWTEAQMEDAQLLEFSSWLNEYLQVRDKYYSYMETIQPTGTITEQVHAYVKAVAARMEAKSE
jgi:hypothetical protein